jgi:hypothetical protein
MRAIRFTAMFALPVGALLAPVVGADLAANAAYAADSAPANTLAQHLVSDGGSFDITLTSTPRTIPLNEMFELTIDVHPVKTVKDTNPVWVSVNATMPLHQHGMNTRPRVEDLGKGRFLVRGMLFHMAGVWEIALDVAKGSLHEHAKASVDLS